MAEQLFLDAIEIEDLNERNAYIETACMGDQTLRREVTGLLGSHDVAQNFFLAESLLEISPEDLIYSLSRLIESCGNEKSESSPVT